MLSNMEMWAAVERFLILTRGYEIRVVPDDVLLKITIECEGELRNIDSLQELFQIPLGQVEYEEDCHKIPQATRDRIRSLAKKNSGDSL